MTNDLQVVVNALRSNPNVLTTGIKQGAYSVAYGKLWRGNTIIGYLPPAPPVEGTELTILNTSHTSPEEEAVFKSPAPPTPEAGAPAISLDSPEGKKAEEKPPAPAPAAGAAPGGGKPPPEINPDVGGTGAEKKPPSQGAVFKKKPGESIDPAGFGAPRGESFYREEYAALNEASLIETRRKLLKANAIIEFDLECKQVTRGVWVHLWLLPSNRVDGKFELYTHTVTSTCNIPSAYSIKREISGLMHDQMPHIVVSDASLSAIARKINLAMRGAKDSLGGSQKSESIEEEIEGYLDETSQLQESIVWGAYDGLPRDIKDKAKDIVQADFELYGSEGPKQHVGYMYALMQALHHTASYPRLPTETLEKIEAMFRTELQTCLALYQRERDNKANLNRYHALHKVLG